MTSGLGLDAIRPIRKTSSATGSRSCSPSWFLATTDRPGLAAGAGANLRELMDRMGHSTARAAMVYPHEGDE